jgi:predicted  nucleic acid-binding Zn-ribbon protein
MDVTSRLVALFQVEKQIRGLRGRFDAAEQFLDDQKKKLDAVEARIRALDTQSRTLTAQARDHEGEVQRLDARLASLREQLNNAQTSKQYQALLTEVNTLKADRDKAEAAALELLEKVDAIRRQMDEARRDRDQREQVCKAAQQERDAGFAEIQGRLRELQSKRAELARDIPAEVMATFESILKVRGDQAMAPVQIEDRRRHEYTCTACQMSLPIESVSLLLSRGSITRCVSCQCILYLDEAAVEALHDAPGKKRERTGRSAHPPTGR